MDLYDSISRRKSCRKYIAEPLNTEQLDKIKITIGTFEPLYPDVLLEYRFVAETKGMFNVKAPHYLIISGQGREGEQENAGFVGQQFMLWLDASGLGGVWLGASKDATKTRSSRDIIVIAFGKPEGQAHRTKSDFKRKNILEITNAPDDICVQAVHLAPSGMNLQPWYLQKEDSKLLFYRQLFKPPISFAYKLTKVDMGIALCHCAIACKHFGKQFRFDVGCSAEAKKGYELLGCVDIAD